MVNDGAFVKERYDIENMTIAITPHSDWKPF